MLGFGIAMWRICCTTSCRIVVSLSVGGVVQHVCSRCPCSGVWHLPLSQTDTYYCVPVAYVYCMFAVLTDPRASRSNNNSNVSNVNASNRGHFLTPSDLWQPPTEEAVASRSGPIDIKLTDDGKPQDREGWLSLTPTVKRRTSKTVRPIAFQPFCSSDDAND